MINISQVIRATVGNQCGPRVEVDWESESKNDMSGSPQHPHNSHTHTHS